MESKTKKKILEFCSDAYTVPKVYDAGKQYIFMIKQKNVVGPIMDPFYSIDKKTLEIKGFVPYMNLEIFNYARQHPVEWR